MGNNKDWNELWKRIRKFLKDNSSAILLAVGLAILASNFLATRAAERGDIEEIPYAEFQELLEDGKIDTVWYSPTEEYMTITLLNEDTLPMDRKARDEYEYQDSDKRRVLYPATDEFREQVMLAGANIRSSTAQAKAMSIAMNVMSLVLPLCMLLWMMGMLKGQMRSASNRDLIRTSDVRFSDVIGQDEIIDDLRLVTELLKNPGKGDAVGAKPPKGLLLQGPPGTGKTLIAKAIAGEAGVPFLQQSASGFIEMYVGLGAKRVRDLFKVAKKNAPCILFIDEIDAVGMNRDNTKGTSENEQTINALLEQMDGFTGREGVFVIAATNRADKLDPALIRPGRFDRQVTVNPPRDWAVRADLFRHYLGKFAVSDDVDIESLSRTVSGFTGADIAAICNEASIVAMMADKKAIDMACIEEAIDKKVFKGNRSKRKQYERDREIVAYHESGHAVMSWLLGEPITRASIQSTVSGVGGAVFNADKDTLFSTKKDFENRLMILYAGRASESIKFGDVTTGASNDITQATNILLEYIEKVGFDDQSGLLDVSVLSREHLVDAGATSRRMADMSKEIYGRCRGMLEQNYDKVERLAKRLLEDETLAGNAIESLMEEA